MYRRARAGVSYLPQEPSVFRKMTVQENLLAILETLALTPEERAQRCAALLAEFGLVDLKNDRAYTLSGGERRRVEIARSLVLSPVLPAARRAVCGDRPHRRSRHPENRAPPGVSGIGVLITDHNVRETLSIVDRAYIISGGEILRAGTPLALSNDAVVKKIYLGEGFRLD